jgi:hypothetical protein
VRTQLLLEPAQHEYLRRRSAETGKSLSSLVRGAIEEHRARDEASREALRSLLGAWRADRDDVSAQHDALFAAAAEQRRPRRP